MSEADETREARAAYDGLPASVADVFGEDATADLSYGLLTVDVPATGWLDALSTARSLLGCDYFDWLSAVDEGPAGFRVSARVFAVGDRAVRALLVRTALPRDAAELPTAVGVYAGAAWHERETHEMFGIAFPGHPGLSPLLLPDTFEGHPLRKDFVLAARVVKAWPGAKDPGESGSPRRRPMLPPGVPDPNEWGPHKGEAPREPGRTPRSAPPGEATRRPRRNRSASAGSATQREEGPAAAPEGPAAAGDTSGGAQRPAAGRPRRARSASGGSASQREAGDRQAPPAEDRAAGGTPAPEAPAAGKTGRGGTAGGRDGRGEARRSDAPWHRQAPAHPGGEAPDSAGRADGTDGGNAPAGDPSGADAPARRHAPDASDAPDDNDDTGAPGADGDVRDVNGPDAHGDAGPRGEGA